MEKLQRFSEFKNFSKGDIILKENIKPEFIIVVLAGSVTYNNKVMEKGSIFGDEYLA